MCGIYALIGNKDQNETEFNKIKHRGPDNSQFIKILNLDSNNTILGFHRLCINDLSENGNQPMSYIGDTNCKLICNGEIYNYKQLQKENKFEMKSNCDCEIILHMYKKYGIAETVNQLDGVFAFILYDNGIVYIARDLIGVRPLFIGRNKKTNFNNSFGFASEVKCLVNEFEEVEQFKPGHYAIISNNTLNYIEYSFFDWNIQINSELTEEQIYKDIYCKLRESVHKRLMSDRPIGCFLSGGLDSSVVCSIMKRKLHTQITTFAIGMKDSNAPDLKYAQIVADYLKTNHHSVYYTFDEGFAALDDLIYTLESYDITTIRASLPQYMLSKYVKENTNITVLLSGEGPDEHFGGYQYLQMAPNKDEFQKEATKLTRELNFFDVLRTDRTTAKHSLEVRVPFLDKEFVKYSLSIPPQYKESKDRIEKYLIRKAFETEYPHLPSEILWRRKNAFSDAVGYQWVDKIKETIDGLITDLEFEESKKIYEHNPPLSKEALYYRRIFEKHYPNRGSLIPHYWMPNNEWTNNEITDPSALKLQCFKDSDTN